MAASRLEAQSANSLRWDLLLAQPPSGERLTVRSAVPKRRTDLLIAIDATGKRHILVEIPQGEPSELFERSSRGIGIQTVEMKVGHGRLANYVDIACLEPQGHAALDVIINELADALDAGASIGHVALIQNVVAKWRRFWSGVSQDLLSRDAQVGLFGELWFLARWLGPCVGLSAATRMWRGPVGARNDFEAPRFAIEVKTTARVDAAHQINGIEQLMQPFGGALFLMSLVVRDEASAMDSLPNLVQQIRRGLDTEYEALATFDGCLYAAGYEDVLEREYSKLKLRVRSEGLYRVEDGFPRLIPSSLVAALPPGVGSVSYELRLDGALPWRVATSPGAAEQLLRDFLSR